MPPPVPTQLTHNNILHLPHHHNHRTHHHRTPYTPPQPPPRRMEAIDVETSSPPSSQPIELSYPARGMKGKVGRTEAIPSSMQPRRPWGSHAGPSRHAGSWDAASDEIQVTQGRKVSKAGELDGTLGHRKGAAYRSFHATLDGKATPKQEDTHKERAVRERVFGDNSELRRQMFGGDTTPKARRPQPESPDPLALSSPDFKLGAPATPTARGPGTKVVKAMWEVSGIGQRKAAAKKAQELDSRYNQRSPSPAPPSQAQTKKVPRREERSPPPHLSPMKKVKTGRASASAPSTSTISKAEPKGKSKSSSRKLDAFPTPSPVDLPSSPPSAPDGTSFFANLDAQEEEEHAMERQRLLDDALGVTASQNTPRNGELRTGKKTKRTAVEAEFKRLEADEQQEYQQMSMLREQRSSTRSHADSFFKNAKQMAEETRRRRSLEAKSLALADTAQFAPKERTLGEDELYCAHFKNHRNLCPHCSEPLPMSPSADLRALQRRYASIRNLSFRQTVTLCTMHRAETTIIPLGLRDGFPKDIDFEDVDRRLERGWIATRLKKVAANPELSKFYRRAKKEINRMGLSAWKDVAHQSNDTVLSYAQPGYYGDLGRAIMIKHFQNLILWGHLNLGAKTAPLPETDFIVTVLVPEAAVLLTMEDEEWDGSVVKGEEWDEARVHAMEICRRAGPYGYWCFRGDGEEGQRVLGRIEQAAPKKKRRLDDARRALAAEIDRKIKAEKGLGAHDAIIIASSDTEQPDESDWGDDEVDVAAFEQAAAAAEERRAAARRQDPDATPQPKRRPLSPRKVESKPRPFKRPSQHSHSSSMGYDDGWDDTFLLSVDEMMKGK